MKPRENKNFPQNINMKKQNLAQNHALNHLPLLPLKNYQKTSNASPREGRCFTNSLSGALSGALLFHFSKEPEVYSDYLAYLYPDPNTSILSPTSPFFLLSSSIMGN